MPYGKEKVKNCKRCQSTQHRTGDRNCPHYGKKERALPESFITAHEDPMYQYIVNSNKREKEERIDKLKALLNSSSSESESESEKKEKKHKKKKKRKRKLDDDDDHTERKRHVHKKKKSKSSKHKRKSTDRHDDHSHRKVKRSKSEKDH